MTYTNDILPRWTAPALNHSKRAALIRTRLDFGQLSPDLVAAIVTGSPVLRALDKKTDQRELIAA